MEAFYSLLNATQQIVADGLKHVGGRIPEIATLQELVSAPPDVQPSKPGGLERTKGLLPSCVELAKTDLDRQLAQALLDAAPYLHWASPYDEHDGGELIEPLRHEYICTLFIGPQPFRRYRSAFRHENLLVAFSLQSPGIYYPPHSHLAREIYHVIAGRSDWQYGEDWSARNSGDWIFHPSDINHAMRTHDEPLLAMATWIDHLDEPKLTVHQ